MQVLDVGLYSFICATFQLHVKWRCVSGCLRVKLKDKVVRVRPKLSKTVQIPQQPKAKSHASFSFSYSYSVTCTQMGHFVPGTLRRLTIFDICQARHKC